MTSSAGGLGSFSGLVQAGFEIESRLGVLLEQLWVAGSAIAVGALHVRRVIESHVPVLGCKREFFRWFLVLSAEPECSDQSGDEETGEEGAHSMNVASFVRLWIVARATQAA